MNEDVKAVTASIMMLATPRQNSTMANTGVPTNLAQRLGASSLGMEGGS